MTLIVDLARRDRTTKPTRALIVPAVLKSGAEGHVEWYETVSIPPPPSQPFTGIDARCEPFLLPFIIASFLLLLAVDGGRHLKEGLVRAPKSCTSDHEVR